MIVCEIGLNHLGKEDYANEYIDEIIKSKADALTFQVREKEFYEKDESYLRLKDDYYKEAFEKTKSSNRKFGVAIADQEAVDFFESLGTDFYKVLSKDIANFALIDTLLDTNKPIFISSGMSDFGEISKLVEHVEGAKERVSLIHTQLSYDIKDVNLRAISLLREKFDLPVAFGNHSPNHTVLFLSLAFQPSDLFMYVKGARTTNHPDEEHAVSLEDIGEIISNVIELPQSLGTGTKIEMNNVIEEKNL